MLRGGTPNIKADPTFMGEPMQFFGVLERNAHREP